MIDARHVLGMNERNVNYVYALNERKNYPLADDKLQSKSALGRAGLPTPKLFFSYAYYYQLLNISRDVSGRSDFVVKPARSMGGGGILVIDSFDDGIWATASGERFNAKRLTEHGTEILNGVYSVETSSDIIMLEEKIKMHPMLQKTTNEGIPDIRIISHKGRLVMAMLRVPTLRSKGRANLHAGGIGVGIELHTGVTTQTFIHNKRVSVNPDNGAQLSGLRLPFWPQILDIASETPKVIPLGYMGIDFVIDERYGPQILEVNVRPGLEIQNINGAGLRKALLENEANA